MEQLSYDLLFRWLVSKNRDRLLGGDTAAAFMDAVLNPPRVKALLSDGYYDGSFDTGKLHDAFPICVLTHQCGVLRKASRFARQQHHH